MTTSTAVQQDSPGKVVWVAAALLRDSKSDILLAKRPPDKPMPNLWELPGGKIEAGENPEAALQRELVEELGLKIDTQELKPYTFLSYQYPEFQLLMLVYECRKWQGTPRPLEGQNGIQWVNVKNLKDYPMPEADVDLVKMLQKESLTQN